MIRTSRGSSAEDDVPAKRCPVERGVPAERWILLLYWLVSGYGLRASRALLALAITIALLGAIPLTLWGTQLDLPRGRARRPEGPHDVEQPLPTEREAQAIVILASFSHVTFPYLSSDRGQRRTAVLGSSNDGARRSPNARAPFGDN